MLFKCNSSSILNFVDHNAQNVQYSHNNRNTNKRPIALNGNMSTIVNSQGISCNYVFNYASYLSLNFSSQEAKKPPKIL